MQKIIFTKMSGAGNDFVVIDKQLYKNLSVDESLVRKLCDRHDGIGADGLIAVDDLKDYDFIMNYYNADGSTGSLCANGARCATYFASQTGRLNSDAAIFLSNQVQYKAELISKEKVRFFLNAPKKIKYNFKIKVGGKLLNAHCADTGSQHVVIDINESNGFFGLLDELELDLLGRELIKLPEFFENGTNVNFIEVKDSVVYIRTYERGVEAETLACGTGSVAAALICYVNHKLSLPIEIIPKSKEKLLVNFDVENSKVINLSLTGPAKIIFTGEIEI